MPKRHRLATGIYQDASGISVIYHAHGAPIETRFEADRPVDFLIRWRKRQIADVSETPRARRGSLARDVVTFLTTRKGLANYKTEKSNLKAWIAALENPQRWSITPGDLQRVMADWRALGYSPQTLRHRFRILRQLFQTLDGSRASSPFDDLPMPEKPRPRPVSVADVTIAEVATALRRQEIIHRLHDGKTRARFLVLATHEQRPAELKRTLPGDVDLTRRVWFVRGAKGSYHTVVPLNDEQLAAWQLFATAKAWGPFDTRNFSRVVQHAGWPKGIRVYNLRHSTGFALSARGVDLGDIQALYGHTSPDTTRIYVPGQMRRLEAAQARLEGRFGATPFFPRSVSTNRPKEDAKGRQIAENFKTEEPAGTTTDRRRLPKTPEKSWRAR